MMKHVILVTLCLSALVALGTCQLQQHKIDHYQLHSDCNNVLNEQIALELYASHQYLNMAGYFMRPTVGRPGYAKFFQDQSLEEYQHATKFMDYINLRNGTVKRLSVEEVNKAEWSNPLEALEDAIKLEKHVYSKIKHIHDIADLKCNDGHLTDFLESYFFTEQVESIKELQEMVTTLSHPNQNTAYLIEHMTDVKMRDSDKKKSEL